MDSLMRQREDKWGIFDLQNCILNIAKYFDEFCETNNIDYCLMGGSALGAVRHKGFIPWDDDLDVFMRPEQFEKFRKAFGSKGDSQKFYLQEWSGNKDYVSFAKLRLNKSHYIETDLEHLNIHKGVYIDIFILHTCPNKKINHWWQYFWSRYLVIKALANRDYKRHGKIGNLILQPLKWLPKRAFVDFALKQIYKHSNEESDYYCHYLGRAGYQKGLYKAEYFRTTKRVPFETISLRVPDKVEDYLKDRWGDYMKIPSDKEIAYYQHSSDWSDSEYFSDYNSEGFYKDEANLIT